MHSRGGAPTTVTAADGSRDDRPESRQQRVGVLGPHNSKETKAILNAVSALGHDPVWVRDENVTSRIRRGSVSVSPPVDVLVNRLLLTKSDQPFEDLQLAALYGQTATVLNPAGAVRAALHKYCAGARLAAAGLPVPDAALGRSPRTVRTGSDELPGRVVHKPTVGTNGGHMTVVADGTAVSPRIDNRQAFLQEFIETSARTPHDLRVYVVGNRVVGAMRRHAPEGDWRTNVALGGGVKDVTGELGTEPTRLAREATETLGLDFAGVDLVPADDGGWYVLEVNATAGFKGLFEATGVSPAPHIAGLAVERAGAPVDPARVADLAATLDDSVPDCKPQPDGDGDGGVLGFTTRVRLCGSGGSERAVAKADTGAKRTSIDTGLAAEVGAGPLVGTTRVRSGAGESETRPLVDLDIEIRDRWHPVTASITDRSGMNYRVLLGRDLLEEYTLDVTRRVEE
ncbi:MAG: RimK/LysX family protein [Halobacteriaceae archaeon]